MVNKPIYRAKKIDSDELVEGYYFENSYRSHAIRIPKGEASYRIDQNTLAIHFPNMIDKNGKKIFASLSEDGVGGDEFIYPKWKGANEPQNKMVMIFDSKCIAKFILEDKFTMLLKYSQLEVIGIHKGEQ